MSLQEETSWSEQTDYGTVCKSKALREIESFWEPETTEAL